MTNASPITHCPNCGSASLVTGPVGNADLPDGWRRIWCSACRWASVTPADAAPTQQRRPAARS